MREGGKQKCFFLKENRLKKKREKTCWGLAVPSWFQDYFASDEKIFSGANLII